MTIPRRWCSVCHRPMLKQRGDAGYTGIHMRCRVRTDKPRLHKRPGYPVWTDDTPEEIEAKFQAALKEVKQSRRLSGDVRWDSTLASAAKMRVD